MPLSTDELLAAYAPKQKEFSFTISSGHTLRARTVADASEWLALEKATKLLQAQIDEGAIHPSWKPFLPVTPDVVRMAVFASALMVEPELSQLKALEYAKTGGMLLLEIAGPILDQVTAVTAKQENEAVEEAKNESTPIMDGETV